MLSGLQFPTPGHLPDPKIKAMTPVYPVLAADSLPLVPSVKLIFFFFPLSDINIFFTYLCVWF